MSVESVPPVQFGIPALYDLRKKIVAQLDGGKIRHLDFPARLDGRRVIVVSLFSEREQCFIFAVMHHDRKREELLYAELVKPERHFGLDGFHTQPVDLNKHPYIPSSRRAAR